MRAESTYPGNIVPIGYRRFEGSSHFGVWGGCWHGVGACPMIEVATLQTLGGPDMSHATFSALDMTTYCGLVELGLVAVGMRCQEGGFVLKCRAANPARLCPGCGHPGDALGSRTRRLAHEPRGHQPTMLVVYVGRYRCRACSRSWCDDISQAAPPRAKLSFGALRWGLVCLIADNMSINRIAAHLAVAWHTVNEAILAYGEELLLADSTRFEGVRVIGVDEHVWCHRGGDRYATVIVDLTPVRDHTGPARLLDVVQGRSKYVLSSWLAACPQEWKDNSEIVAMDGFSGYKSAAASQLPGGSDGNGSLPRCSYRHRRPRAVPPARPARNPGASRPQGRPLVRGPQNTADRHRHPHRHIPGAPRCRIRLPRPRRRARHLEDLPGPPSGLP